MTPQGVAAPVSGAVLPTHPGSISGIPTLAAIRSHDPAVEKAMNREQIDADLFRAAWVAGINVVTDNAVESLQYLATMARPSIARYRASTGDLRWDMDAVLEIGPAKVQRSGEVAGTRSAETSRMR